MGKIKRFTMAMGLAAIAGAVAGVLLAPKKGSETRAQIKKKADRISKAVKETRAQTEARTKKVFKEATHDTMGIYMRAKGMILGEIERIRDQKEIGKTDFDRIVTKVVNQVRKEKNVAVPTTKKLAAELKRDWTVVKKNLVDKSSFAKVSDGRQKTKKK